MIYDNWLISNLYFAFNDGGSKKNLNVHNSKTSFCNQNRDIKHVLIKRDEIHYSMQSVSQLVVSYPYNFEEKPKYVTMVTSCVARAFPGGRLAHPDGQNDEEENEKSLRKNKKK